MRVRRLLVTTAWLAILAAGVGAQGCALDAASGPDHGKAAAAKQKLAVEESEEVVITSSDVDGLVSLVKLSSSSLQIRDARATITPSAELAALLYPGDPSPSSHRIGFDTPRVSYKVTFFGPTVTGWISQLDTQSISLKLATESLDADLVATGRIHIHTPNPYPDADIVIDRMQLHGGVTVDDGGKLALDTVTLSIDRHVEKCGLGGWCSKILDFLLPNLADLLRPQLEAQLEAMLAKPELQNAVVSALDSFANLGGDPKLPKWTVIGTSLSVSGSRITFDKRRTLNVFPPNGCSATVACGDVVTFKCDPTVDTAVLQRLDADGWSDAGIDYRRYPGFPVTVKDDSPPTGATATYHVCTRQSSAMACTNDVVVALPHVACIDG